MGEAVTELNVRRPKHDLVTCHGCGKDVWPFQDMSTQGQMVHKCPEEDCGTVLQASVPDGQTSGPEPEPLIAPAPQPVPPLAAVPALPASEPQSAPIGSAELTYASSVIAECLGMNDAGQIKQRLRRLFALIN